MRFLLPTIALFFLGFLGFSHADLRFASSPKETRFAVRNRDGAVAFTNTLALYMEPATFGYQGLANQRQNNYDNFLRSNIDNEQDNRNFQTEAGKDHLPFRTLEAKATDATNQLPESVSLTVEPGKEYVLPLRWNNPHASEMELNIWINQNTIVVPIKKPVCAGEGYQDGVISFIVPADFNDLGTKVQGFTGCIKPGDCVLQMYAHSVEPRTYAAGTPIIITGWDPSKPAAANNNAVQPATKDPGTDLSKQPNDVCLPSIDPTANIASAVPRYARQVSDVYNHAYQNSDYSPYSGQQHEAISKTMQAAGILRMVNGNRGELGASILTQQQKNTLANLRNTADNIVKNYETITNKIINQVLKNGAKTTATVAAKTANEQKLNNCFRCAEAGSVNTNRQETNTYVPSFKITNQNQLQQARNIIAQTQNNKYANLINSQGVLQIYIQALNDMAPAYKQLQEKYGLTYQPPMVKPNAATMADVTGFRKVNAAGKADGGVYAATKAKEAREAAAKAAASGPKTNDAASASEGEFNFNSIDGAEGDSILLSSAAGAQIDLLSGNLAIEVLSLEGGNLQVNDDDNPNKQNNYKDDADTAEGLPLRSNATPEEIAAANNAQSSSSSSSSSQGGMSTGMVAGIAGAGGAAFVGLIAAGIIIHNKRQQQNAVSTNTKVFQEGRV